MHQMELKYRLFQIHKDVCFDKGLRCEFSALRNIQNNMTYAYQTFLCLLAMTLRYNPLFYNVIYCPTPSGYKFLKCWKFPNKFTDNIICKRKAHLKSSNTTLKSLSTKRNINILDILILAKDGDSNGLIRQEICK